MGDEEPIRVELVVSGGAETRSGSGRRDRRPPPDRRARRVVHGPGPALRVAVAVALLALVAGGLLAGTGGGGDADRPTPPPPRAPAARAYAEAVQRFARAGSFAYHGSVRAEGPNPMQPGRRLASDVSVEGVGLVASAITREVAVDSYGRAAETVTSGPSVWSREASSVAELEAARWERVVGAGPAIRRVEGQVAVEGAGPGRLGMAALPEVLRAAGRPRADPSGPAESHRLRATVPIDQRGDRFGGFFAGAEVVVDLDRSGDITGVTLTTVPPLVVRVAIQRLGERGLISPADVAEPVRETVPTDLLAGAGVRPVELGRLPAGWGLTDAWVTPGAEGRPECLVLDLAYRHLRSAKPGWLSLRVTSEACRPEVGPAWGEPFRTRSFTGQAKRNPSYTTGVASDGTTAVQFNTSLSAADAAEVLGSLVPFG